MKLTFNKTYFLAALLLFCIEVVIAFYLKDGFIRYTVGDFLVVILMYCFIASFIKTKPIYIAITTLLIANAIEFLQMVKILQYFNLQGNKWANLIMGNSFSVEDLVAYTLGVALVFLVDIFYVSNSRYI